jgi:hypothetical protein
VICDQCGHVNEEDANFCSSCGELLGASEHTTMTHVPEDLDTAEDELTLAVPEVPHGTGILVVKRGPNAGSRFTLEAVVTRAGRHPESDIFLDDITVSRRHAEFISQPQDFVVRDVGSLNGTYVNRERIESQDLESGDEVQVGKFKLVFIAGPPRE